MNDITNIAHAEADTADLGTWLIATGLLTDETLAHARAVAAQGARGLAATLVGLGLVDEDAVAQAVAICHDLPLLADDVVQGDLLQAIDLNPQYLRARHAAVIEAEPGRTVIAVAEPDPELLAALRFARDGEVAFVIAPVSRIEALIGVTTTDMGLSAEHQTDADLARMLDSGSDAPVIKLVQTLLSDAVLKRASDVHLEPMARLLIVRHRVDGRLAEVAQYPLGLAAPVISRIKVMAGLDIAETRLPQDGRLRLAVRGRDVDVRVSTSPTAFGESVVLRLLGRSELPLDLEQLGLPQLPLAKLARALERPHGIILVTGPTGSGKSTTLYAALTRLRRPEVKILTVEDPVEVLLEGINQVQVRPEIGLSYAQTLRAFLRQDPDILMIGEIRDRETAEIALRAALTGHLVLSTLHTNSTVGAFTRLVDIGIEPYLTASTVNAVVAQRLIRALCNHCRVERPPSASENAQFGSAGLSAPATIADPGGCAHCQGTGYRGRMPLIEVLEVDSGLRDAVRDGRAEAIDHPVPPPETLLGHGLALVAAGRTTLAEVLRAVQAD